MNRHRWENDVCIHCGLTREKRHKWQRTVGVLRHGVWEDKQIFSDYKYWWYGQEHGFVRPDCITSTPITS